MGHHKDSLFQLVECPYAEHTVHSARIAPWAGGDVVVPTIKYDFGRLAVFVLP